VYIDIANAMHHMDHYVKTLPHLQQVFHKVIWEEHIATRTAEIGLTHIMSY